jgi:hypothetical protein
MSKMRLIDLSQSEIHVLSLAIDNSRAEWDEYLCDLPVQRDNDDWLARNQIQTVKKRVLLLERLAKRLACIAR